MMIEVIFDIKLSYFFIKLKTSNHDYFISQSFMAPIIPVNDVQIPSSPPQKLPNWIFLNKMYSEDGRSYHISPCKAGCMCECQTRMTTSIRLTLIKLY